MGRQCNLVGFKLGSWSGYLLSDRQPENERNITLTKGYQRVLSGSSSNSNNRNSNSNSYSSSLVCSTKQVLIESRLEFWPRVHVYYVCGKIGSTRKSVLAMVNLTGLLGGSTLSSSKVAFQTFPEIYQKHQVNRQMRGPLKPLTPPTGPWLTWPHTHAQHL
jgi:hypothetical protein